MLRAPVLDAVLQMGPYKGRIEEDIRCSQTYFSLTVGKFYFLNSFLEVWEHGFEKLGKPDS